MGHSAGLPMFRLLRAAQPGCKPSSLADIMRRGKGVAGLIEEMFEYHEIAGYAGVKFQVGWTAPRGRHRTRPRGAEGHWR